MDESGSGTRDQNGGADGGCNDWDERRDCGRELGDGIKRVGIGRCIELADKRIWFTGSKKFGTIG